MKSLRCPCSRPRCPPLRRRCAKPGVGLRPPRTPPRPTPSTEWLLRASRDGPSRDACDSFAAQTVYSRAPPPHVHAKARAARMRRAFTARMPGPCIRAPSPRRDCLGASRNAHWAGAALISWSHSSTPVFHVELCLLHWLQLLLHSISLCSPSTTGSYGMVLACKTPPKIAGLSELQHAPHDMSRPISAGGVWSGPSETESFIDAYCAR